MKKDITNNTKGNIISFKEALKGFNAYDPKYMREPADPPPPKQLSELIDAPPPQGSGLHTWAFYAANRAAAFSVNSNEACDFIAQRMVEAGRPEREAMREAQEAIRGAYHNAELKAKGIPLPKTSPKAKPRWQGIVQTIKQGATVEQLQEDSPLTLCNPKTAGAILEQLFGPDTENLVCIAKDSPADARTMKLGEAIKLAPEYSLVCQNRMSALKGPRQSDGKLSWRTNNNIGPRRWAVLEWDFVPDENDEHRWLVEQTARDTKGLCAALLWKMHQSTDALKLVVDSAGKSLQGWFWVKSWSEDEIASFWRLALKLGADHATRTPAQLVRLPNGLRGEKRQKVIYANFEGIDYE